MNLQEIKLIIKDKEAKIQQLRKEVGELRKKDLEIRTGCKEGDLVEDSEGVRGTLVHGGSFYNWYWCKLKKDGTPRASATYLGNEFKKIGR